MVDLVADLHGTEFVLKRCAIQRPEKMAVVKKEIKILQQFKGPYIVELLASEVVGQEAMLLLQLCPGGHLLTRLNSRNGQHLPMTNIYRIFGQLVSAVKPLHEHNPPITHRDLKLENILFGPVRFFSLQWLRSVCDFELELIDRL